MYGMVHDEQLPGEPARYAGQYEELNVLGVPTGVIRKVAKGDLLPTLPRGFTWRYVSHQRLSQMTIADLLEKAAEYRRMATTATTLDVRDALLRLAKRFADAAQERGSE